MPVTAKANQTTQKTDHEAKKVRATPAVNTRDAVLTLDAVNTAADLSTEHILAAQRQVGNRATYDIIQRRSSVGLEGGELSKEERLALLPAVREVADVQRTDAQAVRAHALIVALRRAAYRALATAQIISHSYGRLVP